MTPIELFPLYEHISQESAVEVIKARDPYEIKYAHAGRQSIGIGLIPICMYGKYGKYPTGVLK
jgi:hypothetical protein